MTDRIKLSDGSWMTSADLGKLYRSGTRPKLPVDVDWFMNEGPGRYVVPQHFSGVVAVLKGSLQLKPGRYNLVTDSNEANYDPKALFDFAGDDGKAAMKFQLSNYTTGAGSADQWLRGWIFGRSSFRVKNGKVEVHQDGRVEIQDLEILPFDDNFNFSTKGKPWFVKGANVLWRAANDPFGKGRGVNLEFRLKSGQTGKIFKSVPGNAPGEPNPVYGPDAVRSMEGGLSEQPNLSPINYRSDTARDVPRLQDAQATDRSPAVRSAGKAMNPAAARTLLEDNMMIGDRAIADRMSAIRGLMPDRTSEYWKGPKADILQQEYRDLIDASEQGKMLESVSLSSEAVRTRIGSGIKADEQPDIDDNAAADRMAELQGLMADRHSEYWNGPKADVLQQEYRDLIDLRDRKKRREEEFFAYDDAS